MIAKTRDKETRFVLHEAISRYSWKFDGESFWRFLNDSDKLTKNITAMQADSKQTFKIAAIHK